MLSVIVVNVDDTVRKGGAPKVDHSSSTGLPATDVSNLAVSWTGVVVGAQLQTPVSCPNVKYSLYVNDNLL